MIRTYTQHEQASRWLARYRGRCPTVVCVLGFTETSLIPGISAAGATPDDRRWTALADAEFLDRGYQPDPTYALPPLQGGMSPVFISRAIVDRLALPLQLINAGLPAPPSVPMLDLQGRSARCLTTGQAMDLSEVKRLFEAGLAIGEHLSQAQRDSYLVLGECVVGGTTTALAVLLGLGVAAIGKINSSHPACNHQQKQQVVQRGLQQSGVDRTAVDFPFQVMAALGDPMQPVVAGMAIGASRRGGVLLAGGTQMLAVYALAQACQRTIGLGWRPENIVVGTTRWVAEDPTGDTIGLAKTLGEVPLLAAQLHFGQAQYQQMRVYEQGFVKEGVGAGGCAIAAHLYQNWDNSQVVQAIEALLSQQLQLSDSATVSANMPENAPERGAKHASEPTE